MLQYMLHNVTFGTYVQTDKMASPLNVRKWTINVTIPSFGTYVQISQLVVPNDSSFKYSINRINFLQRPG
jgi:hypothetical protein